MKSLHKYLSLFLFILGVIFTSCERKELPYSLPPKPSDSVSILQVNLGEKYDDQVYVDFLDSNFVKSTVKNNAWDIAIDCAFENQRIYMNGGKGVFIGVLGKGSFKNNVNLANVKWKWDEASGGDLIVVKNWCHYITRQNADSIYIIDCGPEAEPDKRYFQFKITSLNYPYTLEITVANLAGQFLDKTYLSKDPSRLNIYYNFSENRVLNFEPRLYDWQFCFLRTRWVYYEFNPPLVYTVTGIHINTRLFSVSVDSSHTFETLTRKEVEEWKYSSKRDVVGFDWKIYDFEEGRYKARKYVNYIFKTKGSQPKYYKLRFTDYYNKQGLRGSPKFEVAELR